MNSIGQSTVSSNLASAGFQASWNAESKEHQQIILGNWILEVIVTLGLRAPVIVKLLSSEHL